MLSLETKANWAGATVTVQIGAGVATWAGTAELLSAFNAMKNLTDWANGAGRPWFGLALFDWTWQRHASSGGAIVKLRNNGGAFNYTPGGTAAALIGIPAVAGVLTAVGTSAANGTWAPGPNGFLPLKLGIQWLKASGQASGVGAVRPSIPGFAPWVAVCQPLVKAQDCARLTAVLLLASHPRRAWLRLSNVARADEILLPPDLIGWKLVALGAVQRSRRQVSIWQCELAVAGEAV